MRKHIYFWVCCFNVGEWWKILFEQLFIYMSRIYFHCIYLAVMLYKTGSDWCWAKKSALQFVLLKCSILDILSFSSKSRHLAMALGQCHVSAVTLFFRHVWHKKIQYYSIRKETSPCVSTSALLSAPKSDSVVPGEPSPSWAVNIPLLTLWKHIDYSPKWACLAVARRTSAPVLIHPSGRLAWRAPEC